ncbi:S1 family peptidase [Streptomyces olivaceus]|nr:MULTISPECIES: S1 family peptidase [Streptomyces]MBZ6129358.1 S1 family peptidase [Streptomyces olivaceus]MBZ6170805.1 S1 family peptidase [Streptomyces olivaceus]MBZ6177769.1 S1 family peptidase [Streptomyces olivaceus]MBZ6247138.1 S1 family peptidase [Streptomyces olivaceus]MBZ6258455.1 S1 family peptidase [Streptomyces olivaceus]
MRHARRRIVRRAARLAAVGGLLIGGTMVTRAVASEPADAPAAPHTLARSASGAGAGLVERLGSERTAGHWVGDDGRPVVAVTDEETAGSVRRAGATAKLVRHSMSELRSAASALRAAPRVTGTAWALDYRSNEVLVRGDSTVSGSDWSRLTGVAEGIGGFVRMERVQGTFTTRLNGAQPILSTAGRCSAGFNVTDGTDDFILTAGHCGPTGSVWFGDGKGDREVGKTVSGSFPGDDFSLVEYAGGKAGDSADVVAVGDGKGVRITGVGEPAVGQRVFRSGSTSGLRDGRVTALDATVNYPEGTVTGLIETDVCAEPGDSGGPMFSEGVALGVTSGGDGDCDKGGTTFFQPLPEAMEALGVRLIVAGQKDAGQGAAASSPAPGTAAPGAAAPGAAASVPGADGRTLLARLTDRRNVGPGLLVVAGSLVALVATRWIRAEHDRKAYRQQYSATWG